MDSESDTRAVAGEVGFPVAYGVTRETADCIGAFWEPKRDHIQPSEFIMKADGRLMATLYSSAPVGRLDPADTLGLIQFLNQRSG